MVVGAVIGSLALFIMAISPDLTWFSLAFLVLSIANNMIIAPYSALVPDFIPSTQRGIASGWLGGLSMLGYLAGGLLTYHIGTTGVFGAYMVIIFVHGAAMVTFGKKKKMKQKSVAVGECVCVRARVCSSQCVCMCVACMRQATHTHTRTHTHTTQHKK